jgi:protein SCO1/2
LAGLFIAGIAFSLTPCKAETSTVDGIVLEVKSGSIRVAHRPIPKHMPAMAMEFAFREPAPILTLGSRVRFRTDWKGQPPLATDVAVISDGADTYSRKAPLETGALVPDFELVDQIGRPTRLSEFKGKIIVLQFIYTRCPVANVCPRLSSNFAFLQRKFRDHLGRNLMLVSISIDPEHDTSGVLAEYAKNWRADAEGWRLLTGPVADIAEFGKSFGLIFWPDEGAIGHNAITAVIRRDRTLGGIVEGSEVRVDQLSAFVERFLGENQ